MRNVTCPRSCFAYLDFCKHSFMTLISTFNFCAYSTVTGHIKMGVYCYIKQHNFILK